MSWVEESESIQYSGSCFLSQLVNETYIDEQNWRYRMKIFISQPMSDKTDEQIKSERESVKELLSMQYGEVEIIDSFFESAPHDAKPLWFLGKSLELLSGADIAYFCADWEKYRGCKMEHDACIEYGIPVKHYQ